MNPGRRSAQRSRIRARLSTGPIRLRGKHSSVPRLRTFKRITGIKLVLSGALSISEKDTKKPLLEKICQAHLLREIGKAEGVIGKAEGAIRELVDESRGPSRPLLSQRSRRRCRQRHPQRRRLQPSPRSRLAEDHFARHPTRATPDLHNSASPQTGFLTGD